MWRQKLASFRKYLKKVKFPKIYRSIPASIIFLRVILSQRLGHFKKYLQKNLKVYKNTITFITFFSIIILFISFALFGIDVYKSYKIKTKVFAEKQKILFDISYWENIADSYKGYRDAYFKLALLYYQLKDLDKTKENLNKVLELDPNFEEGRKLERILSSKY